MSSANNDNVSLEEDEHELDPPTGIKDMLGFGRKHLPHSMELRHSLEIAHQDSDIETGSPHAMDLRTTIGRPYEKPGISLTETFGGISPDLKAKKDFIIRLTRALHMYGSPVHRTEYNMFFVSRGLGIDGSFAVMPGLLIISFGDFDRDPSKADTHILRIAQGLNCEKLALVDELADKVGTKSIPLDHASKALETIISQKPRYSDFVKTLMLGLSSGSIASLFFGGGYVEMAASCILGLMIGALSQLAGRVAIMGRLLELISALLTGFLARLLGYVWYEDVCFMSISLASIVWLLPGLSLTIAITELATKNLISGTTRLLYALITALQLGFGLSIGSKAIAWALPEAVDHCDPLPSWTQAGLFFTTVIPFNVLLDAHYEQWFPMTLASAVGFGIYYLTSTFNFGSDVCSALSAMAVGITGAVYARFTHHPPLITVLAGILMLVPGSIGVRGVTAFFQNDVVSGINFGFQMITIGLSITIGLFFANMIIFPKKALTPDSMVF